MILVDANILLYSVNQHDPKHQLAQQWLEGALVGAERVGFAWIVVNAFLRVSTQRRIFSSPLEISEAIKRVDQWLAHDNALLVEESPGHWTTLQRLLIASGRGGNLLSDAHLAAIAIDHDATLVTFDSDFAQFPGLRWRSPLGG